MLGIEVDNAVIVEQQQILEQALSTNPKTQKALQKLIRQVIMEARAKAVNNIHFENGDPRGARFALRTAVYKKILGANINIYNRRKASCRGTNYEPPRKLRPKQRGGNRVARSSRTDKFLHEYGPLDRGMILRWVNSGTGTRTAGTRGGRLSGNRGAIAARNFFRGATEPQLIQAADNLATLIDTELESILNKTK